ncbi:sorting nexin-1-like [Sinocyclocheilus grahami]|uniref:sorting nexin-1-like n=1 Tax=Sinocyclocheilus grahami TaxID=75366 RepID=UPI0007AC589B|nr:PREDICTED: sorting nexin-1-like [Sinocyclocheilus grahami]
MAASSERSPPPFPDSEEPELLEDSDEGADAFTGTSISEMDSPSPDSTRPPKDIFNEPPEDIFSDPLSNINSEPQKKVDAKIPSPSSDEAIDLFSDPLDDDSEVMSSPEVQNPMPDLLNEPVEAPKSDVLGEPPVHRNAARQQDVFEDPPKSSSKSSSVKKAASAEMFGDDDDEEDLFKEPPNVVTKKPQPSGPPVDVFTEVKSDVKVKPQVKDDPTDLFAEEALTAPAPKPSAGSSSSRTNGVHSEEQDLFSEATVELSLDSPRNDRKNKDAVKPSVSAPAAPVASSSSKAPSKTLEELEEEESEDKFDLNISITNPEKVGDGMNAYMAYKVSTQTSLTMFRSKTFTVRRRFSDFLGLFEKLSEKHSQNGYLIPPPPEKSILGMTKVKVGKDDPSSAEFVERRRAALERYLQRVVSHPSLLQDPDVREFLEKEELPRAVSTQALSGAGFLKMLNKATDAVSKMTIKMNEQDVVSGRTCSQGCFDQRMKAWQRWQDAENMLQKKREAEAKLLWANKPDKLQQAKDEISEWEAKVTQYEREFERISATVRNEVIRFDKEKARDFNRQVIKYLESLLHSQQQLIKYWDAFLPEAKAIV